MPLSFPSLQCWYLLYLTRLFAAAALADEHAEGSATPFEKVGKCERDSNKDRRTNHSIRSSTKVAIRHVRNRDEAARDANEEDIRNNDCAVKALLLILLPQPQHRKDLKDVHRAQHAKGPPHELRGPRTKHADHKERSR